MLYNNKQIIVMIGDKASILMIYEKGVLKHKLDVADLQDDEEKKIVKQAIVSTRNSSAYFFLDTLDQSYTQKSFSFMSNGNLAKLIHRKFMKESVKNTIRNYYVIEKASNIKAMKASDIKEVQDQKPDSKNVTNNGKITCMLVSATLTERICNWLALFADLPNIIHGIYLLPLEIEGMIPALRHEPITKDPEKKTPSLKTGPRSLPVNNAKITTWKILIFWNRVSGIRMVATKNGKFSFSRLVDFDSNASDFVKKFEEDLFTIGMYIKKFSSDNETSNAEFMIVAGTKIREQLSNIRMRNTVLRFFSPAEFAKCNKLTSACHIDNDDVNFSDEIAASFFASNKHKILKLKTREIASIAILSLVKKISIVVLISVLLMFTMQSIFTFFRLRYFYAIIKEVEKEQEKINTILATSSSENNKMAVGENFDEITDIASISANINKLRRSPFELAAAIDSLKAGRMECKSYNWSLEGDVESTIKPSSIRLILACNILNPSGSVQSLFDSFKALSDEARIRLKGYTVTYSELPTNIKFGEQYKMAPITITISSEINGVKKNES